VDKVPRTTILLTDGEQRSTLAIARSLGSAGHTVHVTCFRGGSLAGASRFVRAEHLVPDSATNSGAFVEEVERLLHCLGVQILIPVTEASLRLLLPCRERWSEVRVPFPAFEVFDRLSNKAVVLDAARELGIATPAETRLESPEELSLHSKGSLPSPAVIKPSRSVALHAGGLDRLGVSHPDSYTELRRALAELPPGAFPVLVQDRIVGPGIGVFLLRREGRTLASFFHRRIREKPPFGGVSVCAESIEPDPALLLQAERLLDYFGWTGLAMVEFKRDAATGQTYLMEVNARFWGSLQLAIDCGVDFPRLLVGLDLGETLPPASGYAVGRRGRWWWGEVDHLLLRLRRSKEALGLPPTAPSRLAAMGAFLRESGRDVVMRLKDPKPFLRESIDWFIGRG
jgi:predicted ATP-grasp superfamily ATP-dependent carboligase